LPGMTDFRPRWDWFRELGRQRPPRRVQAAPRRPAGHAPTGGKYRLASLPGEPVIEDWTDRYPAIARTADCGPGHSELTHADPGGRIDW
jgi:hypothetical protein